MALSDVEIAVTIDGEPFNTKTAYGTKAGTVVGPITVVVDNGKDIGAIRTKSCTLSVRDFRPGSKSYLRFDKPVVVWFRIGGGDWLILYDGTIVESDITIISHPEHGQGVEATITCLDDARKIASLGSFSDTKTGFRIAQDFLEPRFLELADTKRHDVTEQRQMVEGVTAPGPAAVGQDEANATIGDTKYGSHRNLPLTQHLSDYATMHLARAFIESRRWGRLYARLGKGRVYEIPADCVTALGSIKSSTAEKRHRVGITYNLGSDMLKDIRPGGTKAWLYPSTDKMGYEETVYDTTEYATARYDWSGKITVWATREEVENGVSWQARALLARPARDFIISDATILLTPLAEGYGPALATNIVKMIFDSRTLGLNGESWIPTIRVPSIARQSGLPGTLEGIVEQAELTINPLSHGRTHRALLKVTLGPGDVARANDTPRYFYPTWADSRQQWQDAPKRQNFDSWTEQY